MDRREQIHRGRKAEVDQRKKPRVKCLILDHDDTVVKSTPEINYPAFLKSLRRMRPGMEMNYEQFISYNFTPGFFELCTGILKYSPEEMRIQEEEWQKAAANTIPTVYEGLPEILNRYVENGGKIAVSSHSMKKTIVRDYKAAGIPEPDLIFDCNCPAGKRKPDPYALQEVMRVYQLEPKELLMVDDLKPGYDMACAVQVPFACAGWSENQIPSIQKFMLKHCDYYLESTDRLEKLLYEL